MRCIPILSIVLLLLSVACREEITLELPNDDPRLVIEGFVTYWKDAPEMNGARVSLSTTGNYYDSDVKIGRAHV